MKRLNKTILALFVALTVVLTTVVMPAFAADFSVSAVNIKAADGSITATAVINNISGSATVSAKLILAQYNGATLESAVASEEVSVVIGTENSLIATDTEVQDATVKCYLWNTTDGKLSPLTVAANKGANAPALSDILVDGISISGFSADKTSYTYVINGEDTTVPVVKGVVSADDNTYYATTSYSVDEVNNTAVATVTAKSTTGDAEKVYTVNISIAEEDETPVEISTEVVVIPDGVTFGADTSNNAFISAIDGQSKKTSFANTISSGAVASEIVPEGGKSHTHGKLLRNLTGENGFENGARAFTNYPSGYSTDHQFYFVDEKLEGSEYFAFDNANGDVTNSISFDIKQDAEIFVVLNKDSAADFEGTGYSKGAPPASGAYVKAYFTQSILLGVLVPYELPYNKSIISAINLVKNIQSDAVEVEGGKTAYEKVKAIYENAGYTDVVSTMTAWSDEIKSEFISAVDSLGDQVATGFDVSYTIAYSKVEKLNGAATKTVTVPAVTTAQTRNAIVVVKPFVDSKEHVVKGAESESDFVMDAIFTNVKKSKTPVATVTYSALGDGYLRTNLHAWSGTLTGTTDIGTNYTDTGSPVFGNSAINASGPQWVIYTVQDESLVGADYFSFNGSGYANFGALRGSLSIEDGATLMSFELDKPAVVSIVTTGAVQDYVDKDGFTFSSGGFTAAQSNNNINRVFSYKYSKEYPAGSTVTIPYRTALDNVRAPLIAVQPIPKTINPLMSELNHEIPHEGSGIQYEEYAAYYKSKTGKDPVITFGEGVSELTDTEKDYTNNRKSLYLPVIDVLNENSYVYTQTNRFIAELDPAFGLENCYFIRPNVEWGQPGYGWLSAALVGGTYDIGQWDAEAKKSSTGTTIGFDAVPLPWYSFTVNKPCDVIVFTSGYTPLGYTSEGYKAVDLSSKAFGKARNGAITNVYNKAVIKSFEAGQTVYWYNPVNDNSGYTAGVMSEVLPIMVVRFK